MQENNSSSKKWSSLTTGDIITIAVPQPDGSYAISNEEVIQVKPASANIRFLKFKYTSEGKRVKCQCYWSMSNDDAPFLFMGNLKELQPAIRPNVLIICPSESLDTAKEAVRIAIKNVISLLEEEKEKIQERLDVLYNKVNML